MKHFRPLGHLAPVLVFLSTVVPMWLWPRAAYAYIDPGTGGLLVQLILGGVAGALVIVKLYWSKFKGLFRRKK